MFRCAMQKTLYQYDRYCKTNIYRDFVQIQKVEKVVIYDMCAMIESRDFTEKKETKTFS